MKVSIVCATYNRAKLLDNALATYAKQTLPKEEWEYLICDDMSTDDTQKVVSKWISKGLQIKYFTADQLGRPKKPGEWRDGCALRNSLSTYATGRVIIGTHPEIMIPPNALEVMYETVMKAPIRSWVTAVPYWMPNTEMPAGWKKDLFTLREMEGFYDPSWPDPIHSPGAPDYRNQNEERRTTWESEVFWAMRMYDWRWMGGFREFTAWGSVDMDFLNRRRLCNIHTVIAKGSPVPSENLMVFHQWHESKRDMDLAMKQMQGVSMSNELEARKAGGMWMCFTHGPRERAENGILAGILKDHEARYRWASIYAIGKEVADIPCGTGYGYCYLNKAAKYIGLDIDTESIDFAKSTHPDGNFQVANMEMPWPIEDTSLDMVISFEGIEHISDKAFFIKEMYRVLKPGGTFIISTPQLGAAQGTFWDKYMISRKELEDLFSPDLWEKLDWFYQHSYSADVEPQFGSPHPNDEIMILGGTKK